MSLDLVKAKKAKRPDGHRHTIQLAVKKKERGYEGRDKPEGEVQEIRRTEDVVHFLVPYLVFPRQFLDYERDGWVDFRFYFGSMDTGNATAPREGRIFESYSIRQ